MNPPTFPARLYSFLLQKHLPLFGFLALMVLITGSGCVSTPLTQWNAMKNDRLEPLNTQQLAVMEKWEEQPVTTVVMTGAIR